MKQFFTLVLLISCMSAMSQSIASLQQQPDWKVQGAFRHYKMSAIQNDRIVEHSNLPFTGDIYKIRDTIYIRFPDQSHNIKYHIQDETFLPRAKHKGAYRYLLTGMIMYGNLDTRVTGQKIVQHGWTGSLTYDLDTRTIRVEDQYGIGMMYYIK